MICPKCKTKIPVYNFCGNCGATLTEKCPECGGLELIGRKVCAAELKQAKKTKEEFFRIREVKHKQAGIPVLGGLLALLGLGIYITFINPDFPKENAFEFHLIFAAIFIFSMIWIWIFSKKIRRERKADKADFKKQYPAETELISKAEEKEERRAEPPSSRFF